MEKIYSNCLRLARYIFFHMRIERYERITQIDDLDKYYYDFGYICGMCGDVIDHWYGRGGVKKHLIDVHPEWADVHIIEINKGEDKKKKKVTRTYLKPWKNPDSLYCSTKVLEEILKKKISEGGECK